MSFFKPLLVFASIYSACRLLLPCITSTNNISTPAVLKSGADRSSPLLLPQIRRPLPLCKSSTRFNSYPYRVLSLWNQLLPNETAFSSFTTLCLRKVSTFKLSVTLSNVNRFSKFLHCWKAHEICYKIRHYAPHLIGLLLHYGGTLYIVRLSLPPSVGR